MKRQIRSCLTLFCFGLFGIGGLIIGTVLFPLIILFTPIQKQRPVLSNVVRCSWLIFVKIMTFLRLIDVKIVGYKKNIKGHIIVANHPTLLDVVLLISWIPNTVCVVKNGLLKNFFIKNIIQRVYLVNDNLPDFLNKAQSILSQGLNIVIFPEGTRTDNNTDRKWHRGFAQIALRAKAPVLPVHIECQPLILGKLQKWYDTTDRTAKYKIHFLSPIKQPFSSKSSLHNQAKILSELVYSKLFKRID